MKMSGMTGLDVLKWIRRRRVFADTAVIMLSSSDEHTDLERAHALGAQCHLVKHPSVEELAEVLADARRFAEESDLRPALFQQPFNRLFANFAAARSLAPERVRP
jgi:CheY-like chemotaxis protein